jgi:hypothetical protein
MKVPAVAAGVVRATPSSVTLSKSSMGRGITPSPGSGCLSPKVSCYCPGVDDYACCTSNVCNDRTGSCQCGSWRPPPTSAEESAAH